MLVVQPRQMSVLNYQVAGEFVIPMCVLVRVRRRSEFGRVRRVVESVCIREQQE